MGRDACKLIVSWTKGSDTSYVNEDVVEKLGLNGWKEKVIRTGQKLEGGEGWCKHGEGHGFSCKHKREGQTIWCMSLRGALFFMQRCWGQGVNLQFLCGHSHSSVNIIWNTFFI